MPWFLFRMSPNHPREAWCGPRAVPSMGGMTRPHDSRDDFHVVGDVRSFADIRRGRRLRMVLAAFGALLAAVIICTVLPRVCVGGAHTLRQRPEWNLTVVNRWNPIPRDRRNIDLTTLRNGETVDSRIVPDLQRMFDRMRAEGLEPEVTAGHRTREQQRGIMDGKVTEFLEQGMNGREARAEARRWVADPGTSEHELGLAVDINAIDHTSPTANQAVYDWLAANAWDYGFILRYTDAKAEITGTAGEAWHYRYVGRDAAQAMKRSGQCLEEFVRSLSH